MAREINPWIRDEDLPHYDYFGSSDELDDIGEQLFMRAQLEATGVTVTNAQLAAIVYEGISLELAEQWLRGELGFNEAKDLTLQEGYADMLAKHDEWCYLVNGLKVPLSADAVLFNRMAALRA